MPLFQQGQGILAKVASGSSPLAKRAAVMQSRLSALQSGGNIQAKVAAYKATFSGTPLSGLLNRGAGGAGGSTGSGSGGNITPANIRKDARKAASQTLYQ